ncbi:MAG TPA: hypothetical protein VK911_11395 [Vicinamibacterales bacterium]|nr:hypothetical protein [Vicinamibacterales bacterium]
MRSLRNLTLGVVIASLAGLVATASAQKVKPAPVPAYVWQATLPDREEGFNVYGPGTLVPGATVAVFAGYSIPSKTAPGASDFTLRMAGGDVFTGDWIGFTGLTEKTTVGTPLCGFPSFDEEGLILPTERADYGLGCIPNFVSHEFPQWPYVRCSLQLRIPDVNFLEMAEGATADPHLGKLSLTIESTDWAAWSAVGSGTGDYSTGTVEISRLDQDTWETLVSLPLVLAEKSVVTTGRKGTTVVTPAVTTTEPVTMRVKWRRTLVQ